MGACHVELCAAVRGQELAHAEHGAMQRLGQRRTEEAEGCVAAALEQEHVELMVRRGDVPGGKRGPHLRAQAGHARVAVGGQAPGRERGGLALQDPADVHEVVGRNVVGHHRQVQEIAERDAVGRLQEGAASLITAEQADDFEGLQVLAQRGAADAELHVTASKVLSASRTPGKPPCRAAACAHACRRAAFTACVIRASARVPARAISFSVRHAVGADATSPNSSA